MRPALSPRQGVHLVHNYSCHAGECRTCRRGQHKVERLGGGQQNIGRVADQLPPLARRGVTAPNTHGNIGWGSPRFLRRMRNPRKRRAQVALHIRPESFQGRNIQDARTARTLFLGLLCFPSVPVFPCLSRCRKLALTRFCAFIAVERIKRPQESGKGFAGARGGDNKRVFALADTLPGAFLRGGRGAKSVAEPLLSGG